MITIGMIHADDFFCYDARRIDPTEHENRHGGELMIGNGPDRPPLPLVYEEPTQGRWVRERKPGAVFVGPVVFACASAGRILSEREKIGKDKER